MKGWIGYFGEERNYWKGVGVVCGFSAMVGALITCGNMAGDSDCHFSWMRRTHAFPITQWYETGGDKPLDNFPLMGYYHYLAGFIFRLVDNESFFSKQFYYSRTEHKFPMRFTAYVCTLLVLYPAVVLMVTKYLNHLKPLYKLSAIFLILNCPLLLLVDFLSYQMNALHYALYLLAFFLAREQRFELATIASSCCILTKHIPFMMVLPIGMYAVALQCAQPARLSVKLQRAFLTGAKLVGIGLGTFGVVTSPFFILGGWRGMFGQNLYMSKSICSSASVMNFLKHALYHYDTPEYWSKFMAVGMILALAHFSFALVYLFKRPCRSTFTTTFILTMLGAYTLMAALHEKHLIYAMLVVLISFPLYKDLLVWLAGVCTFIQFAGSDRNGGWNAGVFFYSLLYSHLIVTIYESTASNKGRAEAVAVAKRSNRCAASTIMEWLRYRKNFVVGALVFYAVGFYLFALHCDGNPSCEWFTDPMLYFSHYLGGGCFVFLLLAEAYVWSLLHLQSYNLL